MFHGMSTDNEADELLKESLLEQLDTAQVEIACEDASQATVRERIDGNIQDMRAKIKQESHFIKALIRESLAHLQPLNSNFAMTQQVGATQRLTKVDLFALHQQLLVIKGQLSCYIREVQLSDLIKQSLNENDLQMILKQLAKLDGKLQNAFTRMDRLKMLRISSRRSSAFFKADEVATSRKQKAHSPAAHELQTYINDFNRSNKTSFYTIQATQTQ